MKILSWNCKGLGNPLTVNTLRDWCWRECPNIVFVMETMISASRLEKIRNKCGFLSGFCLSSNGRYGGLGLWWKDVNVQLLSYDKNHIAVKIVGDDGNTLWKAVGVYGWSELANKHKTWSMLKALCRNNEDPMVLFRDFNEILCDSEKEGGAIRSERQMDAFRFALDECALGDLGYQGNIFTWQRGRGDGTVIRERLDRAVATMDWCERFPSAVVRHFPLYSSDHCVILIHEGNSGA
ncbi:uncharacterized protein LOC141613350 [Silene latifolia]|uniref:uncharacterized protein LOC141613350 n=1 Tax=Silene latifolia TaxID=37657 RepID=UPI003D787725